MVRIGSSGATADSAVEALSRFRGAMDPTTADIAEENVLRLVLDEVRRIRESLAG
jgi:hypothetical protein